MTLVPDDVLKKVRPSNDNSMRKKSRIPTAHSCVGQQKMCNYFHLIAKIIEFLSLHFLLSEVYFDTHLYKLVD